MKQKRRVFSNILNGIGLPQDLDPHRFLVQWIGCGDCLIEQHRGILFFGKERIRFMTEQGSLNVEGEELTLHELSSARAVVRGDIRTISLGDKS